MVRVTYGQIHVHTTYKPRNDIVIIEIPTTQELRNREMS